MKMILSWELSLALCKACVVGESSFIANEDKYLPILRSELLTYNPNSRYRSAYAGQIQQETCVSLKSKKCWSPTAELKTSREYGFGLGQLTVTSRFDSFKEAKKLDSSLKDWSWENRYNPTYQIRSLVLMDRHIYGQMSWASSDYERMAFTFAAYNGGVAGTLSDRAVCRVTVGCSQNTWFGNVENTSKKAKTAAKGYGKSFFEINREYPRNILGFRSTRYKSYFGE